ncbi:ABC transporter permease [Stieleria tagensis]|uniref:ABC transporter permease n=1 Tax=Stieleria tagensis TaxID=2956795 RepID=UPI00209ADED1|nr:ABC transporter permease [Stieleria tagensis]
MPATASRTIKRVDLIAARAIGMLWQLMGTIGGIFLRQTNKIASSMAALWATLALAVQPRSWTVPVRAVFLRQMLFTAVDAIPSALRFAAAVGVLLIVQTMMWIDMVGVSIDIIAPFLWRSIVREIAPLLACLVVIGRSGIAISAELGTMRAGGEVEVLDSQGIDPMTFLVMPRVLAVMLSVFCLAVVIAVTMVVTGYAVGAMMGAIRTTWSDFFGEISRNFDVQDLIFFASKTLIAGGFAGVICCLEGISVHGAITDVPRATSRAGIRALTAVFAVSAILSILFYDKFLVFKFG